MMAAGNAGSDGRPAEAVTPGGGGRARKVVPGATIPARRLVAVDGRPVDLPDPERLVHLQLRRFAGCPVCDLHLRSVVRRHDDIVAAGIREVVVFHSPAEELRRYVADLPFAVLADPDKDLYVELGAESGYRAVVDPRAWPAIVRGVVRSTWAVLRRRGRAPSLVPHGGRYGLPADFLISADGVVLACRYGEHAADQWSVDEVLTLAFQDG
jgi:hypothetical protein